MSATVLNFASAVTSANVPSPLLRRSLIRAAGEERDRDRHRDRCRRTRPREAAARRGKLRRRAAILEAAIRALVIEHVRAGTRSDDEDVWPLVVVVVADQHRRRAAAGPAACPADATSADGPIPSFVVASVNRPFSFNDTRTVPIVTSIRSRSSSRSRSASVMLPVPFTAPGAGVTVGASMVRASTNSTAGVAVFTRSGSAPVETSASAKRPCSR